MVINQIIENFEAANPGVHVVREVIGWEVLRDIAWTSIEAGEGPDIMYYDAGPGYMGISWRPPACSTRWTTPMNNVRLGRPSGADIARLHHLSTATSTA